MFDRIVVGIDGSTGGQDALALADALAAEDTRVFLVNAFPYEVMPTRGSIAGYEALLRENSDELLRQAASGRPNLRLQAVPDVSPARALHEVAEREEADLLIVGSSHHRAAVKRLLLGDVARATIHGAPCPVAIAPRDFRDHCPLVVVPVPDEAHTERRGAAGMLKTTNAPAAG